MSTPVTFDTASPRYGLPLLFTAQSQKEVYVNEAHAIADALLHCAIEGIATAAPTSPVEGTNWLIADGASGDWAGRSGSLACYQAGGWIYVLPRDGLQVLNRATGQMHRYFGGWHCASAITAPNAGSVIDTQARAAITQIMAALQAAGISAADSAP